MNLLDTLAGLPALPLLALVGLGAALENLVPPIPADTFVVLGAFLAARGSLSPWGVFLVTWGANVGGALGVFLTARRHGPGFFRRGWGRGLLNRRQIAWLRAFHARWGAWAIFLSRFLPGVRAVVPVFAGVSRMRTLPVLVPMAVASALWYGGLVWAGAQAGRNLDAILERLGEVNRTLGWGGAVVALGALLAWTVSRRRGLRRRRGSPSGGPPS